MILSRLCLLALICSVLATQAGAQQQNAEEKAIQSEDAESERTNWLDERTSLEGDQGAAITHDSTADRQISGELRKESGEALQLGFVNLRRVMASVPQLTILRGRLDSEFAQQKAELDRQSDDIQQLENQLAEMPRGEQYSELEKQVIAKRRTFARVNASFRDAYSVRRNEELATLQQQVVDEIVSLAKEEGYDVILNDTGVIYVSGDADLTPIVIERLQQQVRQGQHDN